MTLNLYLIKQSVHTGYDTYSDAVVVATSEREASLTHPNGQSKWNVNHWCDENCTNYDKENCIDDEINQSYANGRWPIPDSVEVKLIGTANQNIPFGVVCASFHAG